VRAFVITSVMDIPARPRIIAGEIAHHLRASLDLLAYQLLRKAGITDEKRLRACSAAMTSANCKNPTQCSNTPAARSGSALALRTSPI
jgi:hypothetical protein